MSSSYPVGNAIALFIGSCFLQSIHLVSNLLAITLLKPLQSIKKSASYFCPCFPIKEDTKPSLSNITSCTVSSSKITPLYSAR